MMPRLPRCLVSQPLRLRLHLRPLLWLLLLRSHALLRFLKEFRLTLEPLSHEPAIQFAMSALRQ
jgi:hypothetical protein